jgi:predicted nucleotidyltransferase/DNA-binding XRE family transcriptional regulator
MKEAAATTLRRARERAQLTQAQLAERANVAQSVVSAYESSRREPSLETLRKLVSAAGFDLDVALVPSLPTSPRRRSVEGNQSRLLRTLRALGATKVRLFGSVARGDDEPDGDIDLLVDVAPDVGLFSIGRMRSEAERILGSSVDIVPANSLKPDVVERVLAEAIPLYAVPHANG